MQFHVTHLARVASTMDAARESAESGAPEGTTVVADEQTAGRGRAAHAWYSPARQSLYVSVVLRPALAPSQTGWITMLAALAVCDCVSEIGDWSTEREPAQSAAPNPFDAQSSVSPSPVSIKWFNDVLLRGRKVCGVLVETSITGEQLDYAVLGIGLNVNTRFDEAPPDVRSRATSLLNEWRGQPAALDRAAVLRRLLARFGARYDALMAEPASPAAEYAAHVETLGRDVRISAGDAWIEGRALRIDADGALVVRTATGERRVGFGEVL